VPRGGLPFSLVPFQPLSRGEQHPKWPPKNLLMQKNITTKQTRNMIGNINHITANGELHQNHITFPPFPDSTI
jgi:hypothetical protein